MRPFAAWRALYSVFLHVDVMHVGKMLTPSYILTSVNYFKEKKKSRWEHLAVI